MTKMNIADYIDIFEPFEKLIEIEILGEKTEVPENNTLLRCFQYLSLESISMGEFCWNGDCANCQVWLEIGSGGEKPALACRTKVEPGMRIVRMSGEISLASLAS
jgi:NADH dehydrogenase/NADH:ubiquinone oxidoreductase subunit G